MLHVRQRRLGARDAAAAARAAATLVAEVLPVTAADVLTACDLLAEHGRLGVRDAIHAAVMKNAGLMRIVSVDGDLYQVKGLQRVKPRDALRLRRRR